MALHTYDTRDYAFIDGNYLRRAYEDTMRKFFPDSAVKFSNVDFPAVKKALNAAKAFYYDSVDEDASDAPARRDLLDAIRAFDGFHVREGSISARKRQKQVDVALAVEALIHSFNKNAWHISLVAGDLDFKPLVDALVNLGIHVHVFYEPFSGARKLYHAADVSVPITIQTFWEWSKQSFKSAHPVPTKHDALKSGMQHQKAGVWKSKTVDVPVQFFGASDNSYFVLETLDSQRLIYRFNDAARLEQFFCLLNGGTLAWQ